MRTDKESSVVLMAFVLGMMMCAGAYMARESWSGALDGAIHLHWSVGIVIGLFSLAMTVLLVTTKPACLCERYGGTWAEHPHYALADWQRAVENHDTRLGYWAWVGSKMGEETGMQGT